MSFDTTYGETQQSLVVAFEWGWLRAAGGYGQRRSNSATQPGLVRLRGPAGAEETRWVPSGGGQKHPAYKNSQRYRAQQQGTNQPGTMQSDSFDPEFLVQYSKAKYDAIMAASEEA